MAPKHSAEGVSCVPQCKRAVVYLTEKGRLLEELRSGTSYTAAGHEFNVIASTFYIK